MSKTATVQRKPKFTIHIVVTRNDDTPPTEMTFTGRRRAFKDGAQTLWMHWVHEKHGGRT